MECLLARSPNMYFVIKSTFFHTSAVYSGWRQTGVAMRKVLGATRKKKLYFEDSAKMPSPDLFSKGSFEGKRSGNSRRAVVLNKLFMRHITDQMATGTCANEILGHGIEINRVQITPDYKILRVYWLAKGTEGDEIVERILQKNSNIIRHELSQLRLMGVVPILQFIKDKHYARIVELDKKLAIADFGEDHTPIDSSEKFKTQFQIFSPLSDNVKEQLKELDNTQINCLEEIPLPPMPQNVLGLDHADILERVKKSKKKSEALHRQTTAENITKENETEESWATFKLAQATNENPLPFEDLQRIAFKQFLQKRQLLKIKANRNKNYIPDLEYIREELIQRNMENLNKFDIHENNEEDFIDEDLEDYK